MAKTALFSAMTLLTISASACSSADASLSTPAVAANPDSACAGLSDDVRNNPLIGGQMTVADAKPLYERQGKAQVRTPLGAEFALTAEQNTNRQWVQRVAECQAAQYAAQSPVASNDPLAIPGAKIEVVERDTTYVVRLTTDNRDTANKIIQSAETK